MADSWIGGAKRWIGLALVLAAVVFVFTQGRSTPRKYPDRIAVRFWHRWQADWEKQVQKIVDAFNESQDKYEVIPLSTPSGGADAKFILGVIGGDPPDVMSIWNGAIPNMAANGFLTPLETLMTPEEKRQFMDESFPVIRDSGMYQGKVYGITIGSDLYALYVNAQQLRDAGFDPDKFPKTLEGLEAMAEKLHRRDKNGNLTRLGFLMQDLGYTSRYFGGGFDILPDGTLKLNTPENRRALESIAGYRKKIGYEDVVRFEAGLNDIEGAASWAFMHGDLTITLDGQWRVEELRKFKPGMDYRVYPIPPPAVGGREKAGTLSGNFMIIPSSAKQKEGAWEFVKFWSGIVNPDRAAEFYNLGGWLPLSPAVANSPTFQKWLKANPQFQAFLDILASPNCKPMPAIANLQFLNDQISRAEDRAIRGTMSAADSLEELEAKFVEERNKRRALGYEE
jgi:multiple sugar transport system substrate-binding protein